MSRNNYSFLIKDEDKLYDWDQTTQGLILSSFYWGYVITHMPGGIIAEKFGGKYSLGIGILCTAIFTLLTPLVVGFGDYKWLIGLRVLEGLGEVIILNKYIVLIFYHNPFLYCRAQLIQL